jgi:hypothetical protein
MDGRIDGQMDAWMDVIDTYKVCILLGFVQALHCQYNKVNASYNRINSKREAFSALNNFCVTQ